ncbi:MAG: hypothetical protein MI919_24025 [Holophagales bacterium]|nr:hypothetical protein [Holophagales bacterium]
MDDALSREIRRRLDRIKDIARELETVFEHPPGLLDTRGFDRKCREMTVHCDWIGANLSSEGHEWMTGSRPRAAEQLPYLG